MEMEDIKLNEICQRQKQAPHVLKGQKWLLGIGKCADELGRVDVGLLNMINTCCTYAWKCHTEPH
jgi:hypothetical protein